MKSLLVKQAEQGDWGNNEAESHKHRDVPVGFRAIAERGHFVRLDIEDLAIFSNESDQIRRNRELVVPVLGADRRLHRPTVVADLGPSSSSISKYQAGKSEQHEGDR